MLEFKIELDQLLHLTRSQLIEHWVKTFNIPVPSHLSLPMMRRIIAYELQAQSLGGLTSATKRRLEALSNSDNHPASQTQAVGTRLVREWNGVTHIVEVHEDGFQWKAKRYRSLSAIAREITGAHWSGPRFFQINKGTSNGK